MPNATPCQLPPGSRLRDSLPRIDYLDSFEVPSRTPEQDVVPIYAAVFGHLPKLFKQLLVLRSHLVKPLGIAGVSYADLAQPIDSGRNYVVGDKIGRWTLFAKHQDELITGANDRHLDFRVSVFRDARPRIVLSTDDPQYLWPGLSGDDPPVPSLWRGKASGRCLGCRPDLKRDCVTLRRPEPTRQARSASCPRSVRDGRAVSPGACRDMRVVIEFSESNFRPGWPSTMASTRRLAAILAADVAGYSRLMGVDEEGTHETLKAHLRELVDPKIAEHHGRIVKNTGDGFLAEFPSVVDGVRCAVDIQRGMIDREPEVPDEQRIRFHIGVNLGDVIVEERDIFGDGVNVAARLEALAEPGGVCISRMVRDQIRDKLPYPFEDRGEQTVKNIARPLRVYSWHPETVGDLPAAIVPHTPSISQPAVAPRLSIVVLPFTNLSNDPEQQYFADGITEDLTTDLSRLENMLVI